MELRPQGLCSVDEPICPKCQGILHGRLTPIRGGGVLATCRRRHRRPDGSDRNCDQKVVLLPGDGGMVTVIGLERREFDAILAAAPDVPLRDRLRALGILVQKVA